MDIQQAAPQKFKSQMPTHIKNNIEKYGMDWVAATRQQFKNQMWRQRNVDLPADFFEELQGPMVRAARDRLQLVDFMRQRGLTQTGGNLGVTISKWPTLGDFGDANQAMSPDVAADDWRVPPGTSFVPIPITYFLFRLDLREQQGWEREGIQVDTTYGEQAMRAVAEKLEDTSITESDVVVTINSSQVQAPGLTNLGNRLTGSLTAVWTDVANRNIVGDNDSDVDGMIETLSNNNFHGPYALGVPGNYSHILEQDYDTSGSFRTIRERIMAIDQIEEVMVLDRLTDDEVVMFEATSQVMDMRVVEDIQVVNWDLNPWSTQFMAFAAMQIRLKSDPDASAAGIAHFT